MAKISRTLLKLFGGSGITDDFEQFGSAAAGSTVKTRDVALIQALAAWDTGLKNALLSGNRAPFLEDINALFYVFGTQLAYLMQDGIPEWEGSTVYFQNSIVKKTGTMELYGSLVNDNQGNALPDQTNDVNWKFLGPHAEAPGIIKDFAGAAVPSGYLLCDGSAVSRTTYAKLYAAIGTAWGTGDGSTTFNIPDLRGKTTFGKASAGTFLLLGSSGGVETHTHTLPTHLHGTGSVGDHQHPTGIVSNGPSVGVSYNPLYGYRGVAYGTIPVGAFASIPGLNAIYEFLTGASGGHNHGNTTNVSLTPSTVSSVPPFAVVNKIIKF